MLKTAITQNDGQQKIASKKAFGKELNKTKLHLKSSKMNESNVYFWAINNCYYNIYYKKRPLNTESIKTRIETYEANQPFIDQTPL
jgi:hypothetical protein